MKNQISTFKKFANCAVVGLAAFSASAQADVPSAKAILKEIDSVCGDTWCSSDFDFSFKSIRVVDNAVTVNFKMFMASGVDGEKQFPRSCTLPNFTSLSQVATFRANSDSVSLENSFYSDLTECIGNHIDAVGKLVQNVTPAKRAEICEQVFKASAGLSYSGAQFTALCQASQVIVLSITSAQVQFSFYGKDASGKTHSCSLCNEKPLAKFAPAVDSCEVH